MKAFTTPDIERIHDEPSSHQSSLSGIMGWWHRFAAPPNAPADASFAQREIVRRGRLSSNILLLMLIFLVIAIVVSFIRGDLSLLRILLPSLGVSVIVLFLNHTGQITIAGIVLVAGFELGYMVSLLTTPGGLHVGDQLRFALLIEPVLLAVSFLPPIMVVFVTLINCVFIWAALTYMPHTPDMGRLLATSAINIIEQLIALQVIVAIITYLWVRSTIEAMKRADRAEALASLQQAVAEQKQQLEEGINAILQTHIRVANGDFNARAPLTNENVLWQIGVSLNNLLSRFQRANQLEHDLQKTREALEQTKRENARLVEFLRTRG